MGAINPMYYSEYAVFTLNRLAQSNRLDFIAVIYNSILLQYKMNLTSIQMIKHKLRFLLIKTLKTVCTTGPDPAAIMSSKRAKGKTTKKRPQRATSNVFAMFDQSQIQEFKEAFNMIDQNRDGFIDKEDLHDMLASLGKMNKLCKTLFMFDNFVKIIYLNR